MNPTSKEVLRGFAALAGVNVAFALLAFVLARADVPPFQLALFAIGLVQFLWAGPWQRWAFDRGRRPFGIGLVIAASVTFLLNGTCFVLVANSI